MTNQERDKLKSLFIEAYKASACNISLACNKIGIGRRTYYLWRDTDSNFRENLEDAKEELIDIVETQVIKNIKDGCTTSAFKFLEAKAKNRGYGNQPLKENKDSAELLSDEDLMKKLKRLRSKFEQKQLGNDQGAD